MNATARSVGREVIIGRNSKVWRAAAANPAVAARFRCAIGHADVSGFAFEADDRVWVFSYSRSPAENLALLSVLAAARVAEVVYVSTATAIVTRLTRCYEYPRVKQRAEDDARRLLDARVLTLGIVVEREAQLPAGRHAATLQGDLDAFLLAPSWPLEQGRRKNLFEMLGAPMERGWEASLHRGYDAAQWLMRRWPCVLRPLDLLLRLAGVRWYGYVNLSDRLWNSTTS